MSRRRTRTVGKPRINKSAGPSPPAFLYGYLDWFAVDRHGYAPTAVGIDRVLGRAIAQGLVRHHGTPCCRIRGVRQEVGYGLCDNRPGIPKFLHPHRRAAYADLVATHPANAIPESPC